MVVKVAVKKTFDFIEGLSKMKRLSTMKCLPTKAEELNSGRGC